MHLRLRKTIRSRENALGPLRRPPQLQTALEAIYSHYEKTYELWSKGAIRNPPCCIVG